MSFRFLSFPVYKDIKTYINALYGISSKFPKDEQFGLVSQLRRAAISIALNLAEGSDRGSDNDFKRFISMSLGSLNETIAILDISTEHQYISKTDYDKMKTQAESIAKQLSGFRKSIS